MAEIGLAATMDAGNRAWRELPVDLIQLADGVLDAGSGDKSTTAMLVASGRALDGYEVRVDAAAGQTGRVEIRGPSIGKDGLNGTSFAGENGWLRTGDLGAVIDGWLYVTGRDDDYIVASGRNIYAPAVEEAIGKVASVRTGRAAAIALTTGEWVVVAEPASRQALSAEEVRSITRDVRRATIAACGSQPNHIAIVGRGAIPVTSSGKLQRAEATKRFVVGTL